MHVASLDINTLGSIKTITTGNNDLYIQPVQPCSPNFPLINYTLNMDGVKFHILAPGDVVAGVPIVVSGLTRDKSFSLTVTACNDVTCRTSTPRTISTCVQ